MAGAIGLIAVMLCGSSASAEDVLVGHPRIIDGDTLAIGEARIRLWGIDAPEMATRDGSASREALVGFVSNDEVRCTPRDRDRYGRTVALCRRADGADLAELMVRAGQARDWPKYSGGYYAR